MKITWKKDPRVPIEGQWTIAGVVDISPATASKIRSGHIQEVSQIQDEDFRRLLNFLNSILVERTPLSRDAILSYREYLKTCYHLKIMEHVSHVGNCLEIRVPFEHADTLLNFISTMGWEYIIQNNYAN